MSAPRLAVEDGVVSRRQLPAPLRLRLRLARVRSGLSQADLARLLGVSQATVSAWELGTRRPSREQAARIEEETDGEVPAAAWGPLRGTTRRGD